VALCCSDARAEKSHQWQVGGGVEAGVEVDVEVHETRAELVAVSAGSESGWRRLTPMMRPQGRKKMVSGGARSSLSGDFDVEEVARRRARR
jgi:hypothetical protein